MNMRILHVLDHSVPWHSGYTFRTLAILREQRKLGWQTFQLTSSKHAGTTTEDLIDGFHFFRTPMTPRHDPIGLSPFIVMRRLETRLMQVIERVRPQILHVHSPVLNAWPTLRVGQRLGIPVVYEVRAFWEDAAVDHGTTTERSLRYLLTRWLESYVLRRVNHVFTICEGLRSDILARGISDDKVTVIPNAVDVDSFEVRSHPDEQLKSQLGLTGKSVLGFIGSFYAYEGLDLLLLALPEILVLRPEVRVLLVGGGPQEDVLKAQVIQLGLSEKVLFVGRVPHDQVNRYYDLIDILVYPRHSMRLTELVTPLKPLEAMAQGRVLVASDVGGHKELIRHGETGILFKADSVRALSQAIISLLDSRDQWPSMQMRGRKFVESERSWKTSVSNYSSIYESLVASA